MIRTVNGYGIAPQANLAGAKLAKADISGADLSGATLCQADLSGATLFCANLTRADLSKAGLHRAILYKADLSGATLYCTNLYGADLSCANLYGAELKDTTLYGANLDRAVGIISFGPVGRESRIGYAVASDSGVNVQLGCFWGPLEEACAAIKKKYGKGSSYEQLVRVAAATLTDRRW